MRPALARPCLARLCLAGLIATAALPLPAAAQSPACEPLNAAFMAVINSQGYRQVVEMRGEKLESLVLGDTIYTKVEGKWLRMKLRPGGRKAMFDQFMSSARVTDCREIGTENHAAGRMRVIEYRMSMAKTLPGMPAGPIRHVIWIGTADGLVHRIATDDVTAHVSYDRLVPPIP